MTDRRLFATVLVSAGLISHALASPRDCKVVVTFRTINGHKRIVDVPITRGQAREAQISSTAAAAYVVEARRRYAQMLGYKDRDHGHDVWKIIPGLRVDEVELKVPGTPTETLRESPL